MKLNFVKVNPCENMTIFVVDRVDSSKHMILANKLMDYNSIHGEQVGFIEEPISLRGKSLNTLRLQMMGGEFCGNATRSLAALMVHFNHPIIEEIGDEYNVILETSGYDELISCQVKRIDQENTYYSRIKMPLSERVSRITINLAQIQVNLIRVDFSGITHFIVDTNDVNDKEELFNAIKIMMDKEEYSAFGIMYYDFEQNYLIPLVYVKATDSKYWERSCASGTSALGVALALLNKSSINKSIEQPGGQLEISVKLDGENILEILLNGKVEIIAEGIVFIKNQL